MPNCFVEGCTFDAPRLYEGKHCCVGHLYRIKKHGSPFLGKRSKGQGTIRKDGYKVIQINGIEWMEHRLVWVQAFGQIPAGHHIHHKNGVKADNRLENLELISCPDHTRLHKPKRPKSICKICGKPNAGNQLCKVHYTRWLRHGDPHINLKPRH